jgi:hypothetical protein
MSRKALRNWRVNWLSRAVASDEGIALVTAMLVMFVVAILATVFIVNLRSDYSGVQKSKEVTSARSAADAGIDQMVYLLQQSSNWTNLPATYNTTSGQWYGAATGADGQKWTPIGRGEYHTKLDPVSDTASGTDLLLTVEGRFPAQTGQRRTLQARVRRAGVAGLNFAMLADRGIDIHHHGGAWPSPTIVTTKLHSNGYVKLQWSSTYRVQQIEAGTSLIIGSGGGATPGGTIPANGYNWAYWVSGTDTSNAPRCFPPKIFPPKTIDSTDTTNFAASWNVPVAITHSCAGNANYSRNAQVMGDVYANTVQIQSTGDTLQPSTVTNCAGTAIQGVNDPITGVCIPRMPADVHAGSVTVGGTTYKGAAAGTTNQITTNNCPACNQGTQDQGGHVGGALKLHPQDFSPGHVDFPSLNYATVYKPLAETDQGGATCSNNPTAGKLPTGVKTCHVFPTTAVTGAPSVDFLTYLATKGNVTDQDVTPYTTNIASKCPAYNCLFWMDANKTKTLDKTKVAYVLAVGNFYLNGGSLALDWQSIRSLFGVGNDKPTPVIMVAGSLIVPAGNINIASSLTVVGKTMDPFAPLGSYPSTTVPGILASGRGIHSADYDTDSGWTSTSQYESLKRNAATVRGLVYSAAWSTTSNKSLPSDQHWHNYDPKNSTTIIGAQVGSTLHDCNSFVFSYDPLVQNLPGFTTSSGTSAVYIVDWKEI